MSHQDTVDQLNAVMTPLKPWGNRPGVDEIAINKPNEAFVRESGFWKRHEIEFDYEDCVDATILSAALRRQTVGNHAPIVGTDIPFCGSTQRLQSMLSPTVPTQTVSMTIRRFESTVAPLSLITSRYDVTRWNKWHDRNKSREADYAEALQLYDAGDLETFLLCCLNLKLNVLLSGATGAGKTTLGRSLLGLVDLSERIITIEDALELIVPHPNCVRLLHSKGGLSSDGVTSQALLEASLRMRPDRIIMQELRDAESAYVYCNEAMTGHPGSITTIHGGSATEAFKRLYSQIQGSSHGQAFSKDVLMELLSGAIDVIIPLKNIGTQYAIREVWFAANAHRHGESVRNLMDGVA